jgi:hypothetical protein
LAKLKLRFGAARSQGMTKMKMTFAGRCYFLAVEEGVTGFACITENCDTAPAGFAFVCFGFFFSRLLLS